MKKNILLSLVILFITSVNSGALSTKKTLSIDKFKSIKLVLIEQEEAWNKGDLDGFMKHYWKSENLQFVSKNGIRKGWQAVYDSYQKNYTSKGEMGKLSFSILDIQSIDKKNALVNGSWKVENKSGVHSGFFTLWFKKIEGKWLIVMDHTS